MGIQTICSAWSSGKYIPWINTLLKVKSSVCFKSIVLGFNYWGRPQHPEHLAQNFPIALIIGEGRNIQNILPKTLLLLDVTRVRAIFWGRPLLPEAISCGQFEAGPMKLRPNLALVPNKERIRALSLYVLSTCVLLRISSCLIVLFNRKATFDLSVFSNSQFKFGLRYWVESLSKS